MSGLSGAALAHLRHELRTPVNHIIGYSEVLIEDAWDRHLEAYVEYFEKMKEQGREILEAIQGGLSDVSGTIGEERLEEMREGVRAIAFRIRETSKEVENDLETGRRQTLADLHAISWAVGNLLEYTGPESALMATRGGGGPKLVADGQARAVKEGFAPARKARKTVRGASGKYRGTILLADDDENNRELLRRRLSVEGHEVVEAGSGAEALEVLRRTSCDLVLLDIMMPVLDGFETLERIKRDEQLRELPVIMISALDEFQSVVRCIEMGAEDYLPKPFNRVLLRARIGASLEKKWLRDQEGRKTAELQETLRLLERAREELDILASQDPLTGLANRRSVQGHMQSRKQRGESFGVVYIDLNGFKGINDTLGHQAGDELLKQVATRLRGAFRSSDLLGRWGGDEFIAVVDKAFVEHSSGADRIAECLRGEFRLTVGSSEEPVAVGAAIGVALWGPGDPLEEVVQRADSAMYAEKTKMKERRRERLRA